MYSTRFVATLAVVFTTIASAAAAQPLALVYRGPAACKGCAEAVARLLQTSPQNFTVTYVGPREDTAISAAALSKADVYAQPGGPDLNSAWAELQDHATEIRNFVEVQGGRYLGFCLGAFLAGNSPGFGFLPDGTNAVAERKQDDAQVTNTRDTIIQVDWKFTIASTNYSKDETVTNQWLYFQDGAAMTGFSGDNKTVLARYSKNGNVAASLTPLGKGWVALVGPHPEATEDWCSDEPDPPALMLTNAIDRSYRLTNPDGVKFDIGYDFVGAAMQAGPLPGNTTGTTGAPKPTSSEESGISDWGRGRGRMTLQNPIGWVVRGLKGLWQFHI